MIGELSQLLPPPEAVKIIIVLLLSFLIGLEREERKTEGDYSFGGVRTFPLIGLVGYAVALLSRDQLLPLSIGFAVVGAFLLMSYRHKLSACGDANTEAPGVTTEISGLTTYVLGALVSNGYFWIAATIAVVSLFLLELKGVLEGLSKRLAPHEILTFTKFMALSAVVLPTLPNKPFTEFALNPFKTWLLVVAVCGISYGSYVLLAVAKREGVLLSGLLGGIYSSTATTVALAKKASLQRAAHLFSGGILIASAMMYLRVTALVTLFNRSLAHKLAVPLLVLGCVAGVAGWCWAHLQQDKPTETSSEFQPKNPLELRSAILFAVLFLGVLVVSRLVLTHFGNTGIFGLAILLGLIDVDAFILGMTQSAGALTPGPLAASSILIAIASNNVAKGFYAYAFADRRTGLQSLALLAGMAALSLIPLWLLR